MARKTTGRKRRLRAHVIADLSRNHVERFVLLAGYSATPPSGDYGLDRIIPQSNPDGGNTHTDLATRVRDDQVAVLRATAHEFAEVAKIALAEEPQLRERLGLLERS